MATVHRTGSKRAARRRVNGVQTGFDDEAFGAQGEGGNAGDDSEIEPVVRKVLSELLSEASEEPESPEGEPPPTDGAPSRAFTRAGTGGGPSGTPNGGDEEVPAEVSEAVQAVMAELSAEQTQALASLFEAMGEASDGERPEAAAAGFSNAAAAGFSSADLRSLDEASAQGVGTVVRWIIRWLTGPGKRYLKAAAQAAKRGTKAFMAWKNRLPWPVRIAISGLGPYAVEELVRWLASQAGIAEARGTSALASAGPGPGGPDDMEQGVRTVLADLLAKPADELQSDEEEDSRPDEDQPSGIES